MEKYFKELDEKLKKAYNVATLARNKGLDPRDDVEILIAKNLAERVEGLISVVASQIKGSGIVERISELEKEHGAQDWKVALTIALEVAQEKFCKFKDKREAMEVGIRVGLAYVTVGVVASPLEGFVRLNLKNRKDGKGEYFDLLYSGPIRSAGGTAMSFSVMIADYIRNKMGYKKYDPTKEEIKRMITEAYDYHERITNLQYLPTEDEIDFLVRNLPVQINGDPSEKREVSNYKNLDRIETDRIRNGPCLVVCEGLAQKAPKLLKQLDKWGKEFDMKDDWGFLEKFINLQKKIKAKGKSKEEDNEKIVPDYTFIKDVVAGRPVLTYPMTKGGFRLRYGRSRVSGFSAQAVHPATMIALNGYIAMGTQLKVERPGKASVVLSCDEVEGPVVKLKNGDVLFLENIEKAKEVKDDIEEIIYLGDLLINYGDFLNRAHKLVPVGYCEERWYLESGMEKRFFSVEEAIKLCKEKKVPLHPRYTFHWADVNKKQFFDLIEWLNKGNIEENKMVLPIEQEVNRMLEKEDSKRTLEILGVPHRVVAKEYIVIEGEWARALLFSLGGDVSRIGDVGEESVLAIVNFLSGAKIKDKSGTFIGARMGRPEKSKQRKLTGSPQVLFPVGNEGGRMRDFRSALAKGVVHSDFPLMNCLKCKKETIYRKCEDCGNKTVQRYSNLRTGEVYEKKVEGSVGFKRWKLDINSYFDKALKILDTRDFPELIKGVRGTSNDSHIPENLVKGILRAKHNLYVNKDGTIRYDMTEMPLTHFKPKEIGTSVEKLKELGYEKDIHDKELENDDQILELKAQDLVLPSSEESLEEGADDVLFRIGNFIDELLVKFYGLESFYNFGKGEELVGHLVLGLSPHTSAGIVGRVIGFSEAQGLLAHPYFHSIMRRDCFGYDTMIPLYDGFTWQNIKIGEFVEKLNPSEKVDKFGTLAKKVKGLYTIGYDKEKRKTKLVKINEFTKHTKSKLFKVKTSDGREIKTTGTHKFIISDKGKFRKVRLNNLKIGESLVVPIKNLFQENDVDKIYLDLEYNLDENIMVRGIKSFVKNLINKSFSILTKLGYRKRPFDNYVRRDSIPLSVLALLLVVNKLSFKDLPKNRVIAAKRDNVCLKPEIPLNDDILNLIGLYVAEGYSRKRISKKGLYQVEFSAKENEIRNRIEKTVKKYFGLEPTWKTEERLVYSSRIFYEFFTNILKCGSVAKEKRIPKIVLNLPKNKIASFLRGYYDGDGSVSLTDLRVVCDSISKGLLSDLELVLSKFGIFARRYTHCKQPGPKVREFYIKKGRKIPKFTITKLTIPSNFCSIFYDEIGFSLNRKNIILKKVLEKTKLSGMKIESDKNYAYPKIVSIEELDEDFSYCLNVDGNAVLANNFLTGQCDGDEACILLLMDALLNFSNEFLPSHRGGRQDEPLVLTSTLIPAEVDDMVFDMDVAMKYPLEFYEATDEYKYPWEVKISKVGDFLGTTKQFEGFMFTHDTKNINDGVKCSSYKKLPTMAEKVKGQMELAEKIRAVDEVDVAKLLIERHFIRDIKGNLRKFSMQQFRCVGCNEKFRRPPLTGKCLKCGGRIIFTIAQGSIVKYLEPSLSLAEKYDIPAYLKQTLDLTRRRIESYFGKEEDKQEGLGKWFG